MTLSTSIGSFRLTQVGAIEARDEHDEKFERCYLFIQGLLSDLSEKDAHDTLNQTVCKSQQAHEEVSLGLLMLILSDPLNAPRYYRDLTYIARDGLGTAAGALQVIILEKYHKLTEPVRDQVFWLLKEMIKGNIKDMENVFYNLLRLIAGGDVNPKNIWLTECVLNIAIEQRAWIERFPIIIAATVYTFLRLIEDHTNALFKELRQKEVNFCVSLLRERFSDCMMIGRDLVRLLVNVARIPEMERLFSDMINNPTAFSSTFTGIDQLMNMRTSRRFLLLRLTPDMEKKIFFLTSSVRFGEQGRYLDWFQRQYLSTPESQTLRCDLIRYICGVIHPPNEILCSNIMPRWALIGWLITTNTSPTVSATLKLALFFDWMFYDQTRDNIMNIEPAILLMVNWARRHPSRTAALLEFLCRICTSFHPPLASQIVSGIKASFSQILEKRVVTTLNIIFETASIDKELSSLVQITFPEHAPSGTSEIPIILADELQNNGKPSADNDLDNGAKLKNNLQNGSKDEEEDENDDNNSLDEDEDEKISSDEEDDEDVKTIVNHKESANNRGLKYSVKKSTNYSSVSSPSPPINESNFDLEERLEYFSDAVKSVLLSLDAEKDNELRCSQMETLLENIDQDDTFNLDMSKKLAPCLVHVLRCDIIRDTFPVDPFNPLVNNPPTLSSLQTSIQYPLYILLRKLCLTPAGQDDDDVDDPHDILLKLVCEMANEEPRLGCLLLFFLRVTNSTSESSIDPKRAIYREFVRESGRELSASLISDADFAQKYNPYLFFYLVPDMFSHFSSSVSGNATLIYAIVSHSDGRQLQEIVIHLLLGKYRIFKKDSLISVITISLEWDTIEQYWLWQLIIAQGYPVEAVLPILPKLDYNEHSEALTNILLLMQREPPSATLMKYVLAREFCPESPDDFVNSILKVWEMQDEQELADLISNQLNSKTNSPNKRKRQNIQKNNLPAQVNQAAENILSHLDHFRAVAPAKKDFFMIESIKSSLNQVYSLCSESQKSRFAGLFNAAGILESSLEKKNDTLTLKTNKSMKGSLKNQLKEESETESDSEEDAPKVKNSKQAANRKKRKIGIGDSDSD